MSANHHQHHTASANDTPSHATKSLIMDHIDDRLYRYRAKRLRFLINGDKYFAGINYALNTEKIRSFDALLNELTRSLSMDHLKLCKGVRYIFSQDGSLVSDITDFQDGQTYICSSTDTFITTDYRISNGMLNWLVRNSDCISSSDRVKSKRQAILSPAPLQQKQRQRQQLQQQQQPNQDRLNTSHNNNNNNISSSSNNGNNSQHFNNRLTNKTPIQQKQRQQLQKNQLNLSHNSNIDKSHYSSNRTINKTPDKTNHITLNPESPQAKQTAKRAIAQQQQQQTNVFGNEVIEKYDIGRPIGDGHFSVVYCCMNKTTQEFCALKLIDKLKCRGRDDMIYNEVKILKQLDHPNIVKLIEEFDYSMQLYLILELVQDGDLFDAISTVTKFSEVHVATMIHNLSSALTYLHKQGIVHRDIKPENLLISVQEDGSQSVKLADFGLAVEVGDNPLYSVCGTAFYVSPEMLNETGYDYKVDVWATGVICFILLCGYPPFTSENESNQDELFDAILAGDFQFASPYWSKISQHAKNLIKCMLTVDPEKRYTAEQVFTHPWTTGTSSNFEGINPMNISRKIALQSHKIDL